MESYRGGSHDYLAARGQLLTPESYRLMSAAELYWGAERYVEEALSFREQAAIVAADPMASQDIITAKPEAILHGMHTAQRTQLRFTERTAILDLDNFLQEVIAASANDSDQSTYSMGASAMRMREGFSLLDKEGYTRACEGVAAMWFTYASQGPAHILNIFDRQVQQDGKPLKKSFNVVLADIRQAFERLAAQDEATLGRVRYDQETWADAESAKLILVDDWVTTGTTMRQNALAAVVEARRQNLPGLASKLEGHVLIARQDQLHMYYSVGHDLATNCKLRSYATLPKVADADIVPSGSHSSVDYKFEFKLRQMTTYLKKHGIDREVPLLALIDSSYASSVPNEAGRVGMLIEITKLNENILANEQRLHRLRRGIDMHFATDNTQTLIQIGDLERENRRLADDAADLTSQYKRAAY